MILSQICGSSYSKPIFHKFIKQTKFCCTIFNIIILNSIGSVNYVVEPLGSVMSALITDVLGRRRTMQLVNVPLIIAWFMMYNATSVTEIFIADILLGLGVGLMESPIITYIGGEPSFLNKATSLMRMMKGT